MSDGGGGGGGDPLPERSGCAWTNDDAGWSDGDDGHPPDPTESFQYSAS